MAGAPASANVGKGKCVATLAVKAVWLRVSLIVLGVVLASDQPDIPGEVMAAV